MLKSLIKLSGKKLLLPMYHAVSDDDLIHIKNLYQVRNIRQFNKDIDFILKYYEPIDIDCLANSIFTGAKLKKESVLFTFDDGLREVYDIIAPILKRKGIPSVFFVNTDFIDNKNLFYRFKASLLHEEIRLKSITKSQLKEINDKLNAKFTSQHAISKKILSIDYNNKVELDEIANVFGYDFNEFLKNNQPYLSSGQIKHLISQGFAIGAHSVDHPQYNKIPFNEQIKQTIESVLWLKNNFEQKNNLFSFPFTDYQISNEFFNTIYSSENTKVDLSFGCAGFKDELIFRHLQRIPMEVPNKSAEQILKKEFMMYLGKRLIAKHLIRRKLI